MTGRSDHAVLRQLFYDLGRPLATIKKAGGQTNRNYAVVTEKGGKFFVRLPWERGDVVDRTVEGKNIKAIFSNKRTASLSPRVFAYVLGTRNILNSKDKVRYQVPDGTMVSEYIEGREFAPLDFQKSRYQDALANLLRRFHASGIHFVNPYNVFRAEVRKYRAKALRHPWKQLLDDTTAAQLKAIERKAEQHLRAYERGVSTHNDVIFQNILVAKNGNLYLLDFEYAGLNTKGGIFYDLGYVLRDSFFNPPRMSVQMFEQFLLRADKAYRRHLDREQIYWSVVAALLVGIWWGVLRYFSVSQKERAYFCRYVQRGVRGVEEMKILLKA